MKTNQNNDPESGSIMLPSCLLVLCIIGIVLTLTSCATYKMRIPLGSDERFGAVDVGVTYYPPRDFSERLHDFLPANPFRPTPNDGKAVLPPSVFSSRKPTSLNTPLL